MLRGRAKTVENGRVRQWSNQWLHEHWWIPLVSVEVAVRRVGWLQAMLRDETIFVRFLWKDVLEEKERGLTATEELNEALRKDGFQSLFLAQS